MVYHSGKMNRNKNRKDMAMVYSEVPCQVAGTFTSNVVKAACVLWDKEIVTHSAFGQAVVVNSGIANACTGKPLYPEYGFEKHKGYGTKQQKSNKKLND